MVAPAGVRLLRSLGHLCSRKPWQKFITTENQHLVSEDAIGFLNNLLKFDHKHRLTAEEAAGHAYFAPVRERERQNS